MLVLLRCPYVLTERNNLLEDFVDNLNVQPHFDYNFCHKLKDTKMQCSAILGPIENTSFNQITNDKETTAMNYVSKYVRRLWNLFVARCRQM